MPESITYPCIMHVQRPGTEGPEFCIFVAKVGEILKWASIKRLTDQPGAPQRAVNKSKLLAVRRFLELDERNTIPSGVIVNLALPAEAFKPVGKKLPPELQLLTITYDEVQELYFQNPAFGFYFQRLPTERLLQNMTRLETMLAQPRTGTG